MRLLLLLFLLPAWLCARPLHAAEDNTAPLEKLSRGLLKAGVYGGTDFRTFAVTGAYILPEITVDVALSSPGRTQSHFGDFWFAQAIRPVADIPRPRALSLQFGLAAGVYEPNRHSGDAEAGIGAVVGFLTPACIRAHGFGLRVQGTFLPKSNKALAGVTVEAM